MLGLWQRAAKLCGGLSFNSKQPEMRPSHVGLGIELYGDDLTQLDFDFYLF